LSKDLVNHKTSNHPTPRKRFGQNFLHDQNIIHKIVAAINPKPGELLVEIGPGYGALTCELLPLAEKMHAIELDRDLIPLLEENCRTLGVLTVESADILKFDISSLEASKSKKLRLIGNLPYNISTPLIFHLLKNIDLIQDMHFMLQREVVDRMRAEPGSKTYGRLSVMIQRHCRVEPIIPVSPGSFNPPPKVDSTVVRLTPWEAPPCEIRDEELFKKIVTAAFSQRRKTLRNSLKSLVSAEQFQLAEIDPLRRAESLSLKEFAKLSLVAEN